MGLTPMIEIAGILVAIASRSAAICRRSRGLQEKAEGKIARMRVRRMSSSGCVTRAGSRESSIAAASFPAMPSRLAACASSKTPPSELIRPLSKAEQTFLRQTAGRRVPQNAGQLLWVGFDATVAVWRPRAELVPGFQTGG